MKDSLAEFPGLVIIHQKIPGSEVGRHQHAEHEFFLPLHGEITIQSIHGEVKVGPGRMLYVPPDLDHSFSSSSAGSGERVIWLLSKKVWGKRKRSPPTAFAVNHLAKELVFYLLVQRDSKGAKYFTAALVESLADSLSSTQLKNSDPLSGKISDERIRRAVDLVESDLSLSLAELARKCGLSLRNFNRLFLQQLGLNPKEYVILRRVEKAKRLLKENRMTVTDIALEVGYQSLSKFIATFKRIEGRLPSDFRDTSA